MKLAWDSALDGEQRSVLAAATAVAKRLEIQAHLVGGPVRDLLLDRAVFDLDFSVEGNARSYAEKLAATLRCDLVENDRFLTWRLEMEGARPIDIVTCRRESYRAPGALPDVDAASLGDDLRRRDFSINALAFDLRAGALIDLHDGLNDLMAGCVRVLHDDSFLDDPTRIYRALRITSRLGFALEKRTAGLMGEAIRSGALRSVSAQRLWRELFLAIDEEEPSKSLIALAEAGALEPLLGGVSMSSGKRESMMSIADFAVMAGATPSGAFLSALIADSIGARPLEGAPLRQHAIEQIIVASRGWRRLLGRLSATNSATRRILLLDRSNPEMRALAASRDTTAAAALREWAGYHATRVDPDFSSSAAARVGKRTGHYMRLIRLLTAIAGREATEAHRFAEAAILRYLQR